MHLSVTSSPHHLAHQTYDMPSSSNVFNAIARKFSSTSKKHNRVSRSRLSCSSSMGQSSRSTTSTWAEAGSYHLQSHDPHDQPPSYHEVVSPVMTHAAEDDRWDFLRRFDTLLVVDDSSSMMGNNWAQTRDALAAIAPICTRYDADGIDIQFLNAPNSPWYQNIKLPTTIAEIFSSVQPRGATPTGQKLHQILKQYTAAYQKRGDQLKPLNIIVITDGEATDDVESTLIATAKKLDRLEAPAWQVGVQFFQVGDSEAARQYLRYLDDQLCDRNGHEIRDMVDTVPWNGENGSLLNAEGILKVVLGAVNRRLDRSRASLHHTHEMG